MTDSTVFFDGETPVSVRPETALRLFQVLVRGSGLGSLGLRGFLQHLSYSLNSVKGVISGIIGVIRVRTRSLDNDTSGMPSPVLGAGKSCAAPSFDAHPGRVLRFGSTFILMSLRDAGLLVRMGARRVLVKVL